MLLALDAPASVDVHTHFVSREYIEYLEGHANHPSVVPTLPWLRAATGFGTKELLAQMDDADVAAAWVSLPPPGIVDAPDAISSTMHLNELMGHLCAASPRLTAIPAVPAGGHPDIARGVVEALAQGTPAVIWHLRPTGPQPDAPEYIPFLQSLADRGTALFLHPGVEALNPLLAPWGLASAVSAPVSSATAVLRLILAGRFDNVPQVTAVVPHLGGVLPFLWARLTEQTSGLAEKSLEWYLANNVIFDSANFQGGALEFVRGMLPQTPVLMGSDAPFRGPLTRAVKTYSTLKEMR
jgi:predicted TIM-barrel fold metal-dependent hydrolase